MQGLYFKGESFLPGTNIIFNFMYMYLSLDAFGDSVFMNKPAWLTGVWWKKCQSFFGRVYKTLNKLSYYDSVCKVKHKQFIPWNSMG